MVALTKDTLVGEYFKSQTILGRPLRSLRFLPCNHPINGLLRLVEVPWKSKLNCFWVRKKWWSQWNLKCSLFASGFMSFKILKSFLFLFSFCHMMSQLNIIGLAQTYLEEWSTQWFSGSFLVGIDNIVKQWTPGSYNSSCNYSSGSFSPILIYFYKGLAEVFSTQILMFFPKSTISDNSPAPEISKASPIEFVVAETNFLNEILNFWS